MIARKGLSAAGALAFLATIAPAQQFNGGIPAGWPVSGTCGALGANGTVTLAPGGGTQYGFVSTAGGVTGVNLPGVGGRGSPTNGSKLPSTGFTASAGDVLSFNFNFVTSDGAGYADYAWAQIARRVHEPSRDSLHRAHGPPPGMIVPGFAMPAPAATLTPSSVPILGGCTSGACALDSVVAAERVVGRTASTLVAASPTGSTRATRSAAAGTYFLEFGVIELDSTWNSIPALAFDGLSLNDVADRRRGRSGHGDARAGDAVPRRNRTARRRGNRASPSQERLAAA